MIASFHRWGTISKPSVGKDVVKALGDAGWSIFRSSAGRPSGPTTFQFDMPSSLSVISSMDGPSPSDSSSRRGGKRSMIVVQVSGFSDFMLKRLWQNPDHRSPICTLIPQQRAILVPIHMNRSLFAFLLPSNPTVLFRMLAKSSLVATSEYSTLYLFYKVDVVSSVSIGRSEGSPRPCYTR